MCVWASYAAQTRLWIAGQKAQQLVFVLSGSLEVYVGDELMDTMPAGEILVSLLVFPSVHVSSLCVWLYAGGLCGEFECLLLRKYVSDCVTAEPCDLLILNAKARLSEQSPILCCALIHSSLIVMCSH